MIKIIIQNKRIYLVNNLETFQQEFGLKAAIILFSFNAQKASDIVNQLLISEMKDVVVVGDIEENINHFKSAFELIVAAGGVVYNSSGEILFIYRKKKWDLPKGKLDEGEDIPTCAIREVMEETGIKAVSIVRPLCTTYHLYIDGDMKLKEVFWFVMQTQHRTLKPQLSEDIQKAQWVNRGNIHIQLYKTYETISDIFMLL